MSHLLRPLLIAAIAALAACAGPDMTKPPKPLGDFRLGYGIVVADNAQTVGPSRKATADEWEDVLRTSLHKRLDRYEGEKLYHIGAGITAYALAVPGVPIVLSPKSVIVAKVDVWDDAISKVINAEPKEFTVFEGLSGSTVIGSGLTKSREEQMQTLADNLALKIEEWLYENRAWFTPEAVAARAALAAAQPAQPAKPAASPAPAPAN
ncbi:MAG: hypothetical protein R3D56_03515 [Paracoccaceae bacterium]|jgi:hypothetical protein